MDLPDIDGLSDSFSRAPRVNRLERWEATSEPEVVDWFWELMRRFYKRDGHEFTSAVDVAKKHIPNFPDYSIQRLKQVIDARLA